MCGPNHRPRREADALADERTRRSRRTMSAKYSADAVDGGRRDEHDRVAGHDQADEHRGLEHDAEARRAACAATGSTRLHRVEDPVEELVHASSVSTRPGGRVRLGDDSEDRGVAASGTATSATDAASAAARTRTWVAPDAASPARRGDAGARPSIAASGFAPDADVGVGARTRRRRRPVRGRGGAASLPTARRAPSSASISVSVTTGALGAVRDREPGDRAVPGAEREPHEVVQLVEVGALVRDHRGELVGARAASMRPSVSTVAVRMPGTQYASGTGCASTRVRGSPGIGSLEQVDELVLAPPLALGTHGGEREVEREQQGDGRREGERRDLRRRRIRPARGRRAGTGRAPPRRRGSEPAGADAEREEASDHREPAGERDRLPERERGGRGARRARRRAASATGTGHARAMARSAEHRRDGEHGQRRASSSSRRRSVAASPALTVPTKRASAASRSLERSSTSCMSSAVCSSRLSSAR